MIIGRNTKVLRESKITYLTTHKPPRSDPVAYCLPRSSQGSIIFTTRDKKTAVKLAGQNVVELSEMDEAGGKQLLEKYRVDQNLLRSQEDATARLARLSELPPRSDRITT